MINYKKIKRELEDNGYVILKKFYSHKNCDLFLKRIKQYSNKDILEEVNKNFQVIEIHYILNAIHIHLN